MAISGRKILFLVVFVAAAAVLISAVLQAGDPPQPAPQTNPWQLHNPTDLEDDIDDGDGVNHWMFKNDAQSNQTITISYTAGGVEKTKPVAPGDDPVGIFPDSGTSIVISIEEQQGSSCGKTTGTYWKERAG